MSLTKISSILLATSLMLFGLVGYLLLSKDMDALKSEFSRDGFNLLQNNSMLALSPLVRLKTSTGYCSGVVVSKVYVVTAAHCIDGLNQRVVVSDDTRQLNIEAITVAYDNGRDLAVVKGNFDIFKRVATDFSGQLMFEQYSRTIVSCGFPLNSDAAVCVRLTINGNYGFMYAAVGGLILPGMSGGPVVDAQSGALIGINSAMGTGFALISPIVALYEGFHL